MDQRNATLAKNLVNYSCRLKKGEKVLIECNGIDTVPLAELIIQEAYKVGAIPFITIKSYTAQRELLMNATAAQLDLMATFESARMREMDAYIGIRAASNVSELADVPAENHELFSRHFLSPVHSKIRVPHTKWVVLRYPNPAMAQLSKMSTAAFQEFYYDVCNLDYSKMDKAMDPLKELMEKTDKVRIVGPGTDLSFSIKNIPAVKCAGELNIPDGEIYTAPVKDSINGELSYNTPSDYHGFEFNDICFEFENGKIVKATANNSERLNRVMDTDEGARFIGEFAIGVNPYVLHPMKDTLFDEKIMGSFHFTPGACYDTASNGNNSAIHWDLVCIQTEEYGGGEIYFDDVLIRKNGIFVLPELFCLNPENLK